MPSSSLALSLLVPCVIILAPPPFIFLHYYLFHFHYFNNFLWLWFPFQYQLLLHSWFLFKRHHHYCQSYFMYFLLNLCLWFFLHFLCFLFHVCLPCWFHFQVNNIQNNGVQGRIIAPDYKRFRRYRLGWIGMRTGIERRGLTRNLIYWNQ